MKNHKWIYDSGLRSVGYKGECKRCGIIRYKSFQGGYEYFDPKTPIGTERIVFERPPCNPEKNVQEMGIKCHI